MIASWRFSALADRHRAMGSNLEDWSGMGTAWTYDKDQKEEYEAIRTKAGVMDVSGLKKVHISGPHAQYVIDKATTRNIEKLKPGRSTYATMLNDAGKFVDDCVIYRMGPHSFMVVHGSGAGHEQLAMYAAGRNVVMMFDDDLHDISLQGPLAVDYLEKHVPGIRDVNYFSHIQTTLFGKPVMISRTGYTGERGYELVAPNAAAESLWDALLAAGEEHGMLACGLGARDTLRTEMGYPLHGQDISMDITPVEARLGWAVGWSKPAFWGREVLTRQREEGPQRVLRGIVATGRGIPRPHMRVMLTADVPVGEVTSGTFSPTLRKGVGLALVAATVAADAEVSVDVRGRREVFALTKPPFVDPSVRES